MRTLLWLTVVLLAAAGPARGSDLPDACPRPAAGAVAAEPPSLHSNQGELKATLSFRTSLDEYDQRRYCYTTPDGLQAPTLHVLPGDEVTLTLINQVHFPPPQVLESAMQMPAAKGSDCVGGRMEPGSTNVHFHGLDLPPACHQDDVLTTLIHPAQTFTYRFVIPADEAPGLYWYHPHAHGFSEEQVQGGASGALVVDGLEYAVPRVHGMPERVMVLRDQPLRESGRPRDSSIPAWDISLNSVPILYPEYQPAVLYARPRVDELWRVLNAAADTHFDLQIMQKGLPTRLALVALDGVPLRSPRTVTHIVIPPGGRAEFCVTTPAEGARASVVTRAFDTGPLGDANPARPIATLISNAAVPATAAQSPRIPSSWPAKPPTHRPRRRRLFYFSQSLLYRNDAKSPYSFFLTEEGQTPAIFDMNAPPKIVVHRGDVEDWTIENRSGETHDFHIHQIHFQVLARNGIKLAEPEVRDTIPVGYWDGVSPTYPSVTLRMDFSSSACAGTVLFHCHILEHEDAGMMSSIQVVSSTEEHPDRPAHSR